MSTAHFSWGSKLCLSSTKRNSSRPFRSRWSINEFSWRKGDGHGFWGHLEKTNPWSFPFPEFIILNGNDLVRFPLSSHVSYDKNNSLFECI